MTEAKGASTLRPLRPPKGTPAATPEEFQPTRRQHAILTPDKLVGYWDEHVNRHLFPTGHPWPTDAEEAYQAWERNDGPHADLDEFPWDSVSDKGWSEPPKPKDPKLPNVDEAKLIAITDDDDDDTIVGWYGVESGKEYDLSGQEIVETGEDAAPENE